MRGEIMLKILEGVADVAVSAGDGVAAFLEAGYGASAGSMAYHFRKIQSGKGAGAMSREDIQKYYVAISKLKKDGLLEDRVSRGEKILTLTKRGIEKLALLRNKKKIALPSTVFQVEKSNTTVIAIFDIPEIYRRKRKWLRAAFVRLGFTMIQKSVWIGKVKIPKSFLECLTDMGIMKYVELFEITKTGTLKNIGEEA